MPQTRLSGRYSPKGAADDPLHLAELRTGPAGPGVAASPVNRSTASATSALATSLDEKTPFLVNFHEGEVLFRSVAPALGDPVPVPAEILLARDTASRKVAAACWWEERFTVVPLTAGTVWPGWGGSPADRFVGGGVLVRGRYFLACRWHGTVTFGRSEELYEDFDGVPPERLDAEVARMLEGNVANLEALARILRDSRSGEGFPVAGFVRKAL